MDHVPEAYVLVFGNEVVWEISRKYAINQCQVPKIWSTFGLNQSMIPVSGDQKFYQMCSDICLPSKFYLENALLWYQI